MKLKSLCICRKKHCKRITVTTVYLISSEIKDAMSSIFGYLITFLLIRTQETIYNA